MSYKHTNNDNYEKSTCSQHANVGKQSNYIASMYSYFLLTQLGVASVLFFSLKTFSRFSKLDVKFLAQRSISVLKAFTRSL